MPQSIVTDTIGESALGIAGLGSEGTSHAFTRNQRWLLLVIGVVAYAVTHLAFSQVIPLFRAPGFGGSLLLDANPIISLTIAVVWCAIVFVASVAIGRGIRPDVGLFAVSVALFAIRLTGGTTREVYLAHPGAGTLKVLAVELLLLGVILGALHLVTGVLICRGVLQDDGAIDLIRPKPEPLGQRLLATFAHFMVVCVIALTVIRSDERMQVIGMLVIASCLASVCAVRFIPATPSLFFWLGPIVAGVVGYLVTSWVGTQNLAIGEPAGYCAGLARGLPLDFASAGVAGSIYGYWIGRGWIPADMLEKA